MKLKRNNKLKLLIPIASMGDIAFLLIIFFMLTSNFVKEKDIELTPPESPDIEKMREVPVSVTMDEEGTIRLQGEECPLSLLENEVLRLLEGKQEQLVKVRIDKELTEEQFSPVLMALSKTGARLALTGKKIQ